MQNSDGPGQRPYWKFSLHNLGLTLATGFILFFFSERLFWTVWRPGDSVGDLLITWLAYSSLAYVFLSVVSFFRVNEFGSLYLAGAIYGWLTEGALIYTLYGTEESAPFPVSVSITGLSWHALISVSVGWYATGLALTSVRPVRVAVISVAVGIFWGVWATFLWKESPPVITGVPEFLGFALGFTVLLAGAWWVSFRLGVTRFRPGWVGLLLCALILGVFFAQHVVRLGWRPLVVLPVILSFALGPLMRHRRSVDNSGFGEFWGDFVPFHLIWFGLMPVTATVVYAAAKPLGLEAIPVTSIVYYWITGPAGFLLFVWAAIHCSRRRPRAQSFTQP